MTGIVRRVKRGIDILARSQIRGVNSKTIEGTGVHIFIHTLSYVHMKKRYMVRQTDPKFK